MKSDGAVFIAVGLTSPAGIKPGPQKLFGEKTMSRYYLARERDGAGDSGPMCMFFRHDGYSYVHDPRTTKPEVGLIVRVGSPYARSYQGQDWWQTTPITEIIEEREVHDEWGDELHVKFHTRNSVYLWKGPVAPDGPSE